MNAIDRIKAHLLTTDLKDKLATLKEDDLEDMMEHINDKAQKEAIDGVACIEDNDVYAWAYEWVMNYDLNSKELIDKPIKERVEEIKKTPAPSIFDKPVPKKKAHIKHEEDGTKVKQTDMFGWEQ